MRHTLVIFLLFSVFFTSCSKEESSEKKYFKTYTIGTGMISESDHILATVEGKNTVDLSFKVPGKTVAILVNPGDHVKKGQILASLGNEESSITTKGLSNVLGDLSGLQSALESLYDARIQNLENDTKKANLGVELAKKDLELAERTFENSVSIFSGSTLSSAEKVDQAEKNLQYVKNNLENSQKLLDTERESIRKNALGSLSNAFIIARSARDFTDETLGITDVNKTKNDAYEYYLGAKDANGKLEAEKLFNAFNSEYQSMYDWYYANIVNKNDVSKESLKEGLTRSLVIVEHLRNVLHALSGVLENSIASSNFPESQIDGLKERTATLLSNLELSILDQNGNGIKGSIARIDEFDSNYTLKLQQLHDAVTLAEKDLALAKAGKDTNSADVRKNLDMLQAGIKMKQDSLHMAEIAVVEVDKNRKMLSAEKDSKLREIDGKSSDTRMNRNLAENSIDSGVIRAPFDGIILKRYLDPGTTVSAGMPILTISSEDGKIVKTYYDQDTYSLKLGDMISVSRSDGQSFSGKIILLNPHPDALHNKGYFEAELSDFSELIGDRVQVMLTKRSGSLSNSGIVIPLSAIISKYGEPGVYVLDEGRAKFTMITILYSDNAFVSVNGLSSGQKIITEGKENILDNEKLD